MFRTLTFQKISLCNVFRDEDYALCTFLDLYFGCFVITWENGEVVLIPFSCE